MQRDSASASVPPDQADISSSRQSGSQRSPSYTLPRNTARPTKRSRNHINMREDLTLPADIHSASNLENILASISVKCFSYIFYRFWSEKWNVRKCNHIKDSASSVEAKTSLYVILYFQEQEWSYSKIREWNWWETKLMKGFKLSQTPLTRWGER